MIPSRRTRRRYGSSEDEAGGSKETGQDGRLLSSCLSRAVMSRGQVSRAVG